MRQTKKKSKPKVKVIFNLHCSHCGNSNARFVSWNLKRYACDKCQKIPKTIAEICEYAYEEGYWDGIKGIKLGLSDRELKEAIEEGKKKNS